MQLNFQCPPSMARHLQMIDQGEYDIPYEHPAPVILDVGANVGGFAIWAVRRWPRCELHCYEPLLDNFEFLKANTELLKRSGVTDRIHLNNRAIGDPAHRKLFLGRNNCGEASFFDLGEQQTMSVDVVTQAPITMPPAHILKMDTEGCEVEILAGLPSLTYDAVLLEYHSEDNRRQADALLKDYALVGGHARCLERGVLKYLHKRLVRS